ncbi:class I SAM-dependent methyltransferase [Kiloniella sp.]|uniref:class I SAM-dependent methyltransferase n=1 Tax=Kiloniella sp. TaxID=1938587 RepID=UPI003A914297
MQNRKYYTEANRISWNEAAPRHEKRNQQKLLQDVTHTDFNALEPELTETLKRIDIQGKRVAQICCNNAKDLLSVMKMGASYGLGVDAASAFIEQGNELITTAHYQDKMELLVSDVYDIPDQYKEQFDVVLTTVGVMSWMPDISAFFKVIHSLIKPGGHYVVEEMHPVLLMYEADDQGVSRPLYSYFKKDPWKDTDGLDYFGHVEYEASPSYSFQHKMDDILMAGINLGMNLKYIREIDRDISNFCMDLEHQEAKPPLGFNMIMQKQR